MHGIVTIVIHYFTLIHVSNTHENDSYVIDDTIDDSIIDNINIINDNDISPSINIAIQLSIQSNNIRIKWQYTIK